MPAPWEAVHTALCVAGDLHQDIANKALDEGDIKQFLYHLEVSSIYLQLTVQVRDDHECGNAVPVTIETAVATDLDIPGATTGRVEDETI